MTYHGYVFYSIFYRECVLYIVKFAQEIQTTKFTQVFISLVHSDFVYISKFADTTYYIFYNILFFLFHSISL